MAASLSGVGAAPFANGDPLEQTPGERAIRSLERCDDEVLALHFLSLAKLPRPSWASESMDAPEAMVAVRPPSEPKRADAETRARAPLADRFLLEWLESSGQTGIPPPVSARGA